MNQCAGLAASQCDTLTFAAEVNEPRQRHPSCLTDIGSSGQGCMPLGAYHTPATQGSRCPYMCLSLVASGIVNNVENSKSCCGIQADSVMCNADLRSQMQANHTLSYLINGLALDN
eukprot:scaffold180464_cov16-Prasinocladus_malaysianus.AAC.2